MCCSNVRIGPKEFTRQCTFNVDYYLMSSKSAEYERIAGIRRLRVYNLYPARSMGVIACVERV